MTFNSHLSNVFALQLWPVDFNLISQRGVNQIGDDDDQPEAPDEGDGVKEICVSASSIHPKVEEGGAQEGGIHDCRRSNKPVTEDWLK